MYFVTDRERESERESERVKKKRRIEPEINISKNIAIRYVRLFSGNYTISRRVELCCLHTYYLCMCKRKYGSQRRCIRTECVFIWIKMCVIKAIRESVRACGFARATLWFPLHIIKWMNKKPIEKLITEKQNRVNCVCVCLCALARESTFALLTRSLAHAPNLNVTKVN